MKHVCNHSWRNRLVSIEKVESFQHKVEADLSQKIKEAEAKRPASSSQKGSSSNDKDNSLRKSLNQLRQAGLQPQRHVTLWGLWQVLGNRDDTPILGNGKVPIMDKQINLIFGGTLLDILGLILKKRDSLKNKRSAILHGYYQYRETGQQEVCKKYLAQLSDQYRSRPVKHLAQIRDRLEQLNRKGLLLLNDWAVGQIDALFCAVRDDMEAPQIPSSLQGRDLALRELSLLFVLALLKDNYYPQPDSPEASWLAGEDPPDSGSADPSWDLSRPGGVFSWNLEEISEELVPDVSVLGSSFSLMPSGPTQAGVTPMEQILKRWNDQHMFLLCGEGGSAVSGAGKSTSLRLLCRNIPDSSPLFLSISQVYSSYELRNLNRENGQPRLLTWLKTHGLSIRSLEELNGRLLVLDGLDEITNPEGVQSLCDDLLALCRLSELRIIVSSKLPPKELEAWHYGLSSISNLWYSALPCQIQPLRSEQANTYLQHSGQGLRPGDSFLNTPFLLSMYGSTQDFLSRETSLVAQRIRQRWILCPESEGPEALFYRYLCVQLCRWCESRQGEDLRNEQDAFFLFFALPAVALRMMAYDICDRYYVLCTADPVDIKMVEQLLNESFPVLGPMLKYFPAYRQGDLEVLATRAQDLTADGFSAGQAAAILHRSFDPSTLSWEYRFVNHAVRDNLAMLHVANLFYIAYQRCRLGQQPWDMKEPFWVCPVHYLHAPTFKRIFGFLVELFGSETQVRSILEAGPQAVSCSGSSGYLLCTIAYEICRAMDLPQKHAWLAAAASLRMQCSDKDHWFGVEYIMEELCEHARQLRTAGDFLSGAEEARSAICLHRKHPEFRNSDGYHSLAKVYLEQVTQILNGSAPTQNWLTCVPEQERVLADSIWSELHDLSSLLQGGGKCPEQLPVFGRILPSNLPTLPALVALADRARLRLECYQQAGRLQDERMAFLLEGSYVAKMLSIYAAFHEGASGAALNMLGCFCNNQQELLENSPDLPFFQSNPHLHCQIPEAQLRDPDRRVHAWQLYLRIYQIQRGLQPYSAKQLAILLLTRSVRLDDRGEAVAGPGAQPELTAAEQNFLWEATTRAGSKLDSGSQIWRMRFLNELLDLPEDEFHILGRSLSRKALEQEFSQCYQRAWARCHCQDRLNICKGYPMDLFTVMLMAEYRPSTEIALDAALWKSGIQGFFQRQIPTEEQVRKELARQVQLPRNRSQDRNALKQSIREQVYRKIYTTGSFLDLDMLRDCWNRIKRLETMTNGLYSLFHNQQGSIWSQVLARLTPSDTENLNGNPGPKDTL